MPCGLGRASDWLTKTESALESWVLPRMRANLFFHCHPGAPDLPILSPQLGSLLPPLVHLTQGLSCLPSSRKPVCPTSKKGERTSPCPGQVVGQERAAPALTHCWEEKKETAALAGFPQRSPTGSSPASLPPANTEFKVRSGEQRGVVERALDWEGGCSPTIAFVGTRKGWDKTSWGRRPSAREPTSHQPREAGGRGGCVPGGEPSSSSTCCLDGGTKLRARPCARLLTLSLY